MTRYTCGDDLSRFVFGKKNVQSGEPEVPSHDKQVGKDLEKLLRDTHVDGDVKNSVWYNF
jgi:hypothetical protein